MSLARSPTLDEVPTLVPNLLFRPLPCRQISASWFRAHQRPPRLPAGVFSSCQCLEYSHRLITTNRCSNDRNTKEIGYLPLNPCCDLFEVLRVRCPVFLPAALLLCSFHARLRLFAGRAVWVPVGRQRQLWTAERFGRAWSVYVSTAGKERKRPFLEHREPNN